MRLSKFGFCALLLAFLAPPEVTAETGRDYDAVWRNMIPSEDVKRQVQKLDQWLFADVQAVYQGPDVQGGPFKFVGALKQPPRFVERNLIDIRFSFFREQLTPSQNTRKVNLVFLGLPDLSMLEQGNFYDHFPPIFDPRLDLGERDGFHSFSQGKCLIERYRVGDVVAKAVAVIEFDPRKEHSEQSERMVLSCINRAFYFYFGFSNVLSLPDDVFVGHFDSSSTYLSMNPEKAVVVPPVLNPSNVGKSRLEILRRIAEDLTVR